MRTYTIEVQEDDMQVRGNALASGDDQADREHENTILERLDSGGIWAWCQVRVHAHWGGFAGASGWLGGCSYRDEKDFKAPWGTVTSPDGTTHETGYYQDMCEEALTDLRRRLADSIRKGSQARRALRAFAAVGGKP